MRTPNLFIAGAPKCGTSSLYSYLQQHPDIYLPSASKEPTFFGSDFYNPRRVALSLEQYLSLFADAKEETIVGEASTAYFFSECAAREIKEFAPSARIIIMLRNPVDLLYALHSQLLYGGAEHIVDFEEALNAEKIRMQAGPVVSALRYRHIAQLATHLQRYFDVFGRDRVHVIIFDDFQRDTTKAFQEALTFLKVSANFQCRLDIVNPNKQIRSRALHRFMVAPPDAARKIVNAVLPRPVLRKVFGKMRRMNTRYVPRAPLDRRLKERLQAEFAPDVERLSTMLGRDLTYWSKP